MVRAWEPHSYALLSALSLIICQQAMKLVRQLRGGIHSTLMTARDPKMRLWVDSFPQEVDW